MKPVLDPHGGEQRLQELRAEFEALVPVGQTPERTITKENAMILLGNFHPEYDPNARFLTDSEVFEIGLRFPEYVAAIRYIIARDFNEFDSEKALMIWNQQKQ